MEQEGTYPLPEAQVDRFMMKVLVTYPNTQEEIEIMRRMSTGGHEKVTPVLDLEKIYAAQKIAERIFIDEKLFRYIADLVAATRNPSAYQLSDLARFIEYGASPRASIFLVKAAKAYAFLQGRGYVTPQDIKSIGADVMRHRLQLSYEAEAQDLSPDDILLKIFDRVDVP